jgi:excisionase family DNA binding protein
MSRDKDSLPCVTPGRSAKLLINIRELSELIGLNCGTIYHFVSQGRIPVVRISSRCIRFRLADIEAWLESKLEYGKKGK